jgi:RsiW-degrading membrane proteinase PrsW (M82 family)
MDEGGEDVKYFLEPDNHSMIIHTDKCPKYIKNNAPDWLGPFDSYDEALQQGSSLEGKSSPKVCGKCTPWRHSTTWFKSDDSFVVKEQNVEDTFTCVKAWLMGRDSPILLEEEPTKILCLLSKNTVYGMEVSREDATFTFKPLGLDTRVGISLELSYSDRGTASLYSRQAKMRVQQVKKELSGFLIESLKDHSKDWSYAYRKAFKDLLRPRPLLSKVVDETPHEPHKRGVALTLATISVVMILLYAGFGFLFSYSTFTENFLQLLLTYGAGAALIFWVYLSDREEREPLTYVALMFCWGVFSGLIAGHLNSSLENLALPVTLLAPFVEEPIKALGLYVFLTSPKTRGEFNSTLDGVMYGFAVGIGFYAAENFLYYLFTDFQTLVIRILLCWGHGLWVAIVGLWIAVNRHRRGYNTPSDMLPGLAVAVTLHFMWNSLGYLGEIGGELIFYLALFELGYLLKIIKESKRDELFAGPDHIVFSRLDHANADKRSHSQLLLTIILIASVGSLMLNGSSYLKASSDRWTTYELYEFHFDYPERLWSEIRGEFEGEAASESYGDIRFGNYFGQPRELLQVVYGSYTRIGYWDTGYAIGLIGDKTSVGEEVNFTVNGHRALYKRFNMTYNGQEFHCVTGGWGCKDTWRCFYVRYYTERDDAFEVWVNVINSFRCHDIA